MKICAHLAKFSMENVNMRRLCWWNEKNCITRWREHDNPTHKSEPARDINNHVVHKFEWNILCNTPIKGTSKKKS